MIGKLRGKVDAVGESFLIIDVNGVGYEVQASSRTLRNLKAGDEVSLTIDTHVREDAIRLFGFQSELERSWFRTLQTIQGVGSKVALAVLGIMAPQDLANAYALLLGLSSHDISAMRELLGPPLRLLYAAHRGEGGRTLSAAFDYGNFVCNFESTIDLIPRFDAHIEVFTPTRVLRVTWDSPYVRNLPGRLAITDTDTRGNARTSETTFWKDPFVTEWAQFHAAITTATPVKTTIEDAAADLDLFQTMIEAMRG